MCVCACVRVFVHACVRACVHSCMSVFMWVLLCTLNQVLVSRSSMSIMYQLWIQGGGGGGKGGNNATLLFCQTCLISFCGILKMI